METILLYHWNMCMTKEVLCTLLHFMLGLGLYKGNTVPHNRATKTLGEGRGNLTWRGTPTITADSAADGK